MHKTTSPKRRAQHHRANLIALAWIFLFLFIGALLGGLVVTAANASVKPPKPQKTVLTTVPAQLDPQETEPPETLPKAECVATDYSSLDGLEWVGSFTVTAYCPCVTCCGVWSADHPSRGADYIQRTSSGTIPKEGHTVAADWRVLPAGSEIVIGGHTYIVEDTGGAIKGNRIDIYFSTHGAALEWGIREMDIYQEIKRA